MISNFLARMWSDFAPAVGNHLWQSTLFVGVVALLALAFRSNRAGTRYALWLAASVKFLFPFSLLTILGSYFGSIRAHSESNAVIYSTIVQISQPFAGSSASTIHQSAAAGSPLQATLSLLPLLLIVWLAGTLVVFTVWLARWYRVSAIAKRSTALRDGIEAEVVAHLQARDASQPKIEIVSTTESIEPGIFGIVRPVLLWPEAMKGQVTEAHIESIVEHELCHVRRRDNLTAMLHMFVEALFWFHPFVWWVGGRLVEDRERACDEAVVDSGRERRVYAESILKVCEFCAESPLPCVPGVSGADLKHRISQIMSHRAVRPIGLGHKLLLVAACCLAITAPLVSGALKAPGRREARAHIEMATPSVAFSEVTIKPDAGATAKLKANSGPIVSRVGWKDGELKGEGMTVMGLLMMAYRPMEILQMTGGPDWIKTEVFNIHAKASAEVVNAYPKMTQEQRDETDRVMLQNLLATNFGLKVHQETKVQPIYDLVVDNADKLKTFDGECPPPPLVAPPPPNVDPRTLPLACGVMHVFPGELQGNRIRTSDLLRFLSMYSGRVVQDKTNLTKRYDVNLRFTPDASLLPPMPSPPGAPKFPQADPNGPSLFDALMQQVGLRLVPQTGPVEMLVVDDATMPGGSGGGR
jgi:bla regulator protein blaR1